MALQVRATRFAEDRKPFTGKVQVPANERQRKGLREISNIPSVTKNIADLSLSSKVSHKTIENKKIKSNGITITKKEHVRKADTVTRTIIKPFEPTDTKIQKTLETIDVRKIKKPLKTTEVRKIQKQLESTDVSQIEKLLETVDVKKLVSPPEVIDKTFVKPQGTFEDCKILKPLATKDVNILKPVETAHGIEDIDKVHNGNIYLVGEYAKYVYSYLLHLENKFKINKWPLTNPNITEMMRTILVDWLVDVHVEFHLLQETLHTAVSILDRFLQTNDTLKKNDFQLAGVSSLSLACKYEEMLAPLIDDYLYLCKNAYQRTELIEMEKKILKALDYDLGRPVSVVFLRRYNMAAKADKLQHCYSKYFIDMVLLDSKFCHIKPSLIAAAAAFIAMCIIEKNVEDSLWTPTMVHYSTYSISDVKTVASMICKMLITSGKSKYDSVRRKYSEKRFLGVSMLIVSSIGIVRKIANSTTTVAAPV